MQPAALGSQTDRHELHLRRSSGDDARRATSLCDHVSPTASAPTRIRAAAGNGFATAIPAGFVDVTFHLSSIADVNNWLGRSMWSGDANANSDYAEVRDQQRGVVAAADFGQLRTGAELQSAGHDCHAEQQRLRGVPRQLPSIPPASGTAARRLRQVKIISDIQLPPAHAGHEQQLFVCRKLAESGRLLFRRH